jgi:hypothetical protein
MMRGSPGLFQLRECRRQVSHGEEDRQTQLKLHIILVRATTEVSSLE